MQVISEGSVRVDLVGGTLDLEPINLIIPNVVTLNVATSLKAKVIINKRDDKTINIISKDYNSTYKYNLADFTPDKLYYSHFFEEMSFLCQLIYFFKPTHGFDIELSSGAPAGSGLGGSSSMGVTLFRGFCDFYNIKKDIHEIVHIVKATEGRILNQGVPGYQDYYPALTGGILCLKGDVDSIKYEQLFTDELKSILEKRMTLVYSNISRDSGINNWEVYKGFFDKNKDVVNSMNDIAKISFDAYNALLEKDYEKFLLLVGLEGEKRKSLAANIMPEEISTLHKALNEELSHIGIKMCGAGGGGCFLVIHSEADRDKIKEKVEAHQMKILEFQVTSPLE